ncbi:MAG TPA: nuclear transport factor 2 family protein, partial [Pyrinomonadaceae bacterium]|nr:nuclear transport factor 2 family protein [Pyrinomonadaceae bacterium]
AIIDFEHRLFTAIRDKDDVALSGLLADDFIFRGPGQPEMDKTEFLKSVKSFPVEILEIWSDDMKANVYGDFAVLTGVQQARTRDQGGTEQLSAGAFSDVFAKRDGRWLLVLAYNVDLPEHLLEERR